MNIMVAKIGGLDMEDDKFALHGFLIMIVSEEMTHDWLKKINNFFKGFSKLKITNVSIIYGVLMFVDKKVEFCVKKM